MTPRPKPVGRILFIFPPTRVYREGIKQAMPALGPAYLAAVVRDKCEVAILDATAEGFHIERPSSHGFYVYGLPLEEIGRRIKAFQPDLVGVTCLYSTCFPVVAEICRTSKASAPAALTMVGGSHPSFLAARCLEQVPEIDLVALGEGEPVLLDLLDALERGRELASVDGLAYRDPATGRAVVNPKTRFIEQMDTLPLPARDLLPMQLYQQIGIPHLLFNGGKRFSTVITSRGCPFKCNFCSSSRFWGKKYRTRTPDKVLDELELLARDFDVEEVEFEDDNLGRDRDRFRQILEGMVQRKLGLSWCAPNGLAAWALDRDTIRLMKESGCYEVNLGIESGNQQVLDEIIRKPLQLEKIHEVVAEIKKVRIRVGGFFVVGFPHESIGQMKETLALPKKLDLEHVWFFIANALPGSRLYETCLEEGCLKEGFDFVNNSYSRCNIETPQWTSRDVEKLVHWEFLKFNLHTVVRHPLIFWQRYRHLLRNRRFAVELARGLARRSSSLLDWLVSRSR